MIHPILPTVLVVLIASNLGATDYGVSASKGNDANPGTLGQPFKTLTKAFSVARSNDRVFVFPGRYSPSHGETFPLVVASGVKVLGVNARSCVIDAEFDPTVTNPKDPKVNPVQGTVVRIGANTEFANLSIVNGPRNPANPGANWWNITLHIDDSGGNADNVHVHHCVLDEFSRGIFVGGPSGNHNFKNVHIENCVLSRFYVEAINGTVNSGTATGNRVLHCTIVGHRNPATNKNFGRACISFGPGTQFDVRNCVLKDADWAGLEVSNNSSVSSDYNCYHGSGAATRGINPGSNDLQTDPGLAFLPTVTTTVDPHHAGPRGPLWEKGTNILTTGSDLDDNSQRLNGAFVDIGADEFTGTDTWFVGPSRIGTTFHIGALGTAGQTVLYALGLGTIPPVAIPGIQGRLYLDLTQPHVIFAWNTDARGLVRQPAPIPNDVRLIGVEAFAQCLDVRNATFSDLDRIAFIR